MRSDLVSFSQDRISRRANNRRRPRLPTKPFQNDKATEGFKYHFDDAQDGRSRTAVRLNRHHDQWKHRVLRLAQLPY